MNINDVCWESVFIYSPDSPSGLRCKSTGKSIGSICVDSRNKEYRRWRIVKFGKYWLAHRIIWVMLNGFLGQDEEVDHIDGDALNNLSDNLRKIDKPFNRRNSSKRRDNSSGFTGIQISECGYRAIVKVNKKDKSKHFAFLKYGKDNALQLAIEWRERMIKELNSNGAGYTERHGL